MLTRDQLHEQATAIGGTVASWTLAITGWSLADVQQIVAIASGLAALTVSVATLWFMFRKKKGGG